MPSLPSSFIQFIAKGIVRTSKKTGFSMKEHYNVQELITIFDCKNLTEFNLKIEQIEKEILSTLKLNESQPHSIQEIAEKLGFSPEEISLLNQTNL